MIVAQGGLPKLNFPFEFTFGLGQSPAVHRVVLSVMLYPAPGDRQSGEPFSARVRRQPARMIARGSSPATNSTRFSAFLTYEALTGCTWYQRKLTRSCSGCLASVTAALRIDI